MSVTYATNEQQHIDIAKQWRSHDELEEWTGADFLISPLNLPTSSKVLIGKHLKAGAFLVQRKKGNDLVSALGESGNLWDMLDRMNQFCAEYAPATQNAQKIILGIGNYYGALSDDKNKNDEILKVNGKTSPNKLNYWQLVGTLEHIAERGGCYSNVSAGAFAFTKWVTLKERHAIENKNHPIKYSIPRPAAMYDSVQVDEKPIPLQELVVVRDFRRTLITLPGMGETRANAVWEYAMYNGARALCAILDEHLARSNDKPSGIAVGLIRSFREYFGLKEGENIEVVFNGLKDVGDIDTQIRASQIKPKQKVNSNGK